MFWLWLWLAAVLEVAASIGNFQQAKATGLDLGS